MSNEEQITEHKYDFEKILSAINIERKYKFIDIHGKECKFSDFIKRECKKISKISLYKKKWLKLIEYFNFYEYENYAYRQRAVNRCLDLIDEEKEISTVTPVKKGTYTKNIFEADVMYVKGVGPKIASLLNKIGIYTVYDLITYYPKRYIAYSSRVLIKDLVLDQTVSIMGYVKDVSHYTTKRNLTVLNVKIKDESGFIEMTHFYAKTNRYMLEHYKKQFPLNSKIMVSGKVKIDSYTGRYTLQNPEYKILDYADDDDEIRDNLNSGRIVPVYPLCENLNVKILRRAVDNALKYYDKEIKDLIPQKIMQDYLIDSKKNALRNIHFPTKFEDAEKARYSLVFEELFLLEMRMLLIRNTFIKNNRTDVLKVKDNGLVMKFINNLPFELTSAQKKAINEIFNDINSNKPMQRLLQGDVGSGKTVVGCTMLLAAVENGFQSAIMAPTEILAGQHYNNFKKMLEPLGLRIALFTSANKKKVREELNKKLENGEIDIAVGTHALIQDNVKFKNLGAVIIDEQHRFGVKQRNALKTKATLPQVLTMSATPIPRTLALTLHGDLDLTIINEMPKGRKPVKTILLRASERKNAYELIIDEIKKGHQAYIVFPLIEESETITAKAATVEAEKLKNGVFKDYRLGLLHGKMKADEKDNVMMDFKNKKYDVLVSTTVIEVGVDVPDATIIMIENAERFGLSQLHQLRGRVGRNQLQSYCILVSSSKTPEGTARLNIMTQTNDGFIVAEKDLELRGPGEFLGMRQSGLPELNLTDLTRDLDILEKARNSAIQFLEYDDLNNYPDLKYYLEKNTTFDNAVPD